MIQYNENNTSTQVSQIQNMVLAGAKVIIVCPYDNGSLSAVLKEAREAGVVIINYDLAVVGTDDVDYFVGYNNREVGVMESSSFLMFGLHQSKKDAAQGIRAFLFENRLYDKRPVAEAIGHLFKLYLVLLRDILGCRFLFHRLASFPLL